MYIYIYTGCICITAGVILKNLKLTGNRHKMTLCQSCLKMKNNLNLLRKRKRRFINSIHYNNNNFNNAYKIK